MRPEQIRYLLEYNIWADNTVLKGGRQLSPSQIRDKIGIAWESAFDTLVHIMAGQPQAKTGLQRRQAVFENPASPIKRCTTIIGLFPIPCRYCF